MVNLAVAQTPDERILKSIKASMDEWIKEAGEKLVQDYTDEFQHRIREVVAQTAMAVQRTYSLERDGPELIIRVRIEDKL